MLSARGHSRAFAFPWCNFLRSLRCINKYIKKLITSCCHKYRRVAIIRVAFHIFNSSYNLLIFTAKTVSELLPLKRKYFAPKCGLRCNFALFRGVDFIFSCLHSDILRCNNLAQTWHYLCLVKSRAITTDRFRRLPNVTYNDNFPPHRMHYEKDNDSQPRRCRRAVCGC